MMIKVLFSLEAIHFYNEKQFTIIFSDLRHLVLEYCRWGSLESILPKIIIGDDGASSFVPKIVRIRKLKNHKRNCFQV